MPRPRSAEPDLTGSVGFVSTQKVTLFDSDTPLRLARGGVLAPVEVAYETYGELSRRGDNAVFVCHALTGDAHAAGYHPGARRPGWWDTMIGPGKPLDTTRMFVVCANLIGGCQGTTGPASTNPATGAAYGMDFPLLDMVDFVTVHRALLKHLGVTKLVAAFGGSLGGMQVLEWALRYPEDMATAVVIAASSRLSAQNIAFSAVAREAITRDPGFAEGQYAAAGTAPQMGLSIARMMAHITYLSEEAMTTKFGREPQESTFTPGFGADFAVESYLRHQGESFLERFDALSYLYLTRVMDYFDPFADAAATDAIAAAGTKVLVTSFSSDWRFSPMHSQRIVRTLERAGVPVTYRNLQSDYGHDSFLLEVPGYQETVRAYLDRALEELG
ncbi:MAG TPA: homoserine O-acetyltransferase [Propionibacteriaceae bacterium]|nr:homoserine O-acetyltransferase [Propionibacteriaceae bacterium]